MRRLALSDVHQTKHRLTSLRYPQRETLHPYLSKMCPVNILIRLCESAGWSEFVLGAHVWMDVSLRCGSNVACCN